jgi:hypothetical protein
MYGVNKKQVNVFYITLKLIIKWMCTKMGRDTGRKLYVLGEIRNDYKIFVG